MYPQGHAAINLLLLAGTERIMTRLSPWRMPTRELALPVLPALAAAVLPDAVDKIVCDVLHWAPYGRNWMHNLTAMALFTAGLGFLFRKLEIACSWLLGHLGHLLGDFVFIPWLWPWVGYVWPREDRPIAQGVIDTAEHFFTGSPMTEAATNTWVIERLVAETFFVLFALCFYLQRDAKQGYRYFVGSALLWEFIALFWDMEPFVWTLRHYGRVP